MKMTIAGRWRYPVKTLAGEPIDTAEVTRSGIPGDRVVHVRGPEGVRTSATPPAASCSTSTIASAGNSPSTPIRSPGTIHVGDDVIIS